MSKSLNLNVSIAVTQNQLLTLTNVTDLYSYF